MPPPSTPVPSATQLVARQHDGPAPEAAYGDTAGTCYFCGHAGPGQPVADAINHDYFTDDDLMQRDTGHVCACCAYCMNEDRALKIGHWMATSERYERVATGDLLARLRELRDGAVDPPLAFHVAKRGSISQHSYLWTPVALQADPLRFAYARRTAVVALDTLLTVIEAVEEVRWHGFRLADIRQGRPRPGDLRDVGWRRYDRLDGFLAEYRGTAVLEAALTASRAADDQDRDEPPTTDLPTPTPA